MDILGIILILFLVVIFRDIIAALIMLALFTVVLFVSWVVGFIWTVFDVLRGK